MEFFAFILITGYSQKKEFSSSGNNFLYEQPNFWKVSTIKEAKIASLYKTAIKSFKHITSPYFFCENFL